MISAFLFLGLIGALIPRAVVAGVGEASQSPVIVVALTHAPPYQIIEKNRVRGFYVEVFDALAADLGWRVEYQEAPFRRALKMLEDGVADVMLGLVKSEGRQGYIDFPVAAYPPERLLFMVDGNKVRIDRYDDLQGKRIGVLRGAVYFEPFDSDHQLLKVEGTEYAHLLLMLEKGHIDTLIMPEMLSYALAREMGVRVRRSGLVVAGTDAYIAMSRKSSFMSYRSALCAAFARLKADSTYDDLLVKYLGQIERSRVSGTPTTMIYPGAEDVAIAYTCPLGSLSSFDQSGRSL